MSGESLKSERETAIRKKAEALFSSGILSEKVNQAFELSQMQGLDMFFTEVPWRITLSNAKPIRGGRYA